MSMNNYVYEYFIIDIHGVILGRIKMIDTPVETVKIRKGEKHVKILLATGYINHHSIFIKRMFQMYHLIS